MRPHPDGKAALPPLFDPHEVQHIPRKHGTHHAGHYGIDRCQRVLHTNPLGNAHCDRLGNRFARHPVNQPNVFAQQADNTNPAYYRHQTTGHHIPLYR